MADRWSPGLPTTGINVGQHGWGSVGTWAPILAGVVLLAGFVACERRSTHPLIELGLFRNGHFVWGTAHATIANFAFFGLLFAVPQYFQSVDGITPLGTGIRLLPMVLGLVIGTQLSGQLAKNRCGQPSGESSQASWRP